MYRLKYRGNNRYTVSKRYLGFLWMTHQVRSGPSRQDPMVNWYGNLEEATAKVADLRKVGTTIKV